jgi:Cu-processing system permease protein
MSTIVKIMRYELRDVLRSRSIIAYAVFFFLVTETLLRFAGGPKAALSLMNVVLLLIPLVSIVFSTIYLYHAREFTEMLLAQPSASQLRCVGRSSWVWWSRLHSIGATGHRSTRC